MEQHEKRYPRVGANFTGDKDPSYLPLEEHVGIIQKFEEVQCFNCRETHLLLVVFIRVICPSHLPIVNFHLHFRCTKPNAQEFKSMRHVTTHIVGEDRVIQSLFWIKHRWHCGRLCWRL